LAVFDLHIELGNFSDAQIAQRLPRRFDCFFCSVFPRHRAASDDLSHTIDAVVRTFFRHDRVSCGLCFSGGVPDQTARTSYACNNPPVLAVLLVTFPFFALVLCSYVAVRRSLLPALAIPALNSFVLFFALPCLLYRFGATTPIAQSLDPSVLGVYLLCALLMVGVTVWLSLSRRIRWKDAAFGALVAA